MTSASAEPAGDAAAVDACALVSKEAVATLIGVTVDACPTPRRTTRCPR
ncbi:MAG: hypothetical protein QOI25_4563 [Mycobacterium sp.]|jgi:hypothetical protein|nr:hypothetical protein [Mycobacterium sp.]